MMLHLIQLFIFLYAATVILYLMNNSKKWEQRNSTTYKDTPSPVLVNIVFAKKVKFNSSLRSEESKILPNKSKTSEISSLSEEAFHTCSKTLKAYSPETLPKTYDKTLIRRHPNLPEFLIRSTKLSSLIPSITRIRWNGNEFQESWKENPKCFLYSANFDSRLATGLVVRLLSLCEESHMKLDFHCQFWYNETEPPVVGPIDKASFPELFTSINMTLKPIVISCKVPLRRTHKAPPTAVSLVKKSCTLSTNILQIGGCPYKKEVKLNDKKITTIGLCGQTLNSMEDISIRLVEWIEILKILGISKFFLYKTFCHVNVEKVLNYYEKKGVVKVLSFQYLSYMKDRKTPILWAKSHLDALRGGQIMFYNDCILRNKDDFDYLAIFDYNEIPILEKHQNLTDLLKHLREKAGNKKVAGYGLLWKTFYSNLTPGATAVNISDHLYILRHNRRTSLHDVLDNERYSKGIYDTRNILYVDWNRPLAGLLSDMLMVVNRTLAYTGHFPERVCDSSCLKHKFEEAKFSVKLKDLLSRTETILSELNLKSANLSIKKQ